MIKRVIISTDLNPDYLFFLPLTCWAWKKIGWGVLPIIHETSEKSDLLDLAVETADLGWYLRVDPIEGYRSATIAQISRLYAGHIAFDDHYMMTGDVDLIPLSDYWKVDANKKTVWGMDLTGFKEAPISYIGMMGKEWREVMRLPEDGNMNYYIKRDLDAMPNAKSDDFYKWWGVDQQLITERLKPYNPTLINRGQYSNGYAVGRVDRGSWTLDHETLIDAHLFHQVYHKGREQYFDKTMELLTHVWPDEDFTWFLKYNDEFRKLTGHA